ncbi:AAA family ATPase [Candidatus Nitrosotenuis sp. DW1]|uniref:AAA family ATPase n=1 Tax=Candidatus Nitrosotenuis sp. DW1 TaxID=2259672 RepID=UPI0015C7C0DD|nr:ATP-binding protein [Candidatus Nitrosotenuis sp. DW1]QLH09498.1 hypothetical protein DSQ19_08450 [Candidatus Nitrosotenuis sp. DW1]
MKTNPFVFGTIVGDENFADRKNELKELTSDLSSRTNLIIFSPRRYGKTSLIFKVIEQLQKKGIICAYVDLYPAATKEKFANIFASSIARAKAGKMDEIIHAIRDLIPPVKLTLRPEGTSEYEGGVELELSHGKNDVDSNLTKLYDLPEKIAKKKNKKMVVVFDEFQEIGKLDGTEIENNLRSKIQRHKNVSYVFMGSQRHLLDQMFNDKNRALYRAGKPFNLGRIPEEEFGTFIKERFKAGGINVSEEVISKILQLTQCHPYYTQQLCHEIWNYCMSQDSKSIEERDVLKAKEQVMKNQNYAYTSMWDSTRGRHRALLLAMAISDEKGIFSSKFRERHRLGAPSTVARAADALEEKGLIEKDGNDYVVSDTFFQEWIRKIS